MKGAQAGGQTQNIFVYVNFSLLQSSALHHSATAPSSKLAFSSQRRKNEVKIEAKKKKFEAKKKALEARLRRNSSSGELLTPEREAILDLGILELSEKLRSGHLDPVAVMEAYLVSLT